MTVSNSSNILNRRKEHNLILITVFIFGMFTISEPFVLPCLKGYTGFLCNSKCQYPLYGEKCTQTCSCPRQFCDHRHGCKRPAEKCSLGYTGIYCQKQCPYPEYGDGCQQICLCSIERCSVFTGCQFEPNTDEKLKQRSTKHASANVQHREATYAGKPALKKMEGGGNFRKRLFLFTSKTTWIRVSSITFVTVLFLLIISHIVITVVTRFKEDGN